MDSPYTPEQRSEALELYVELGPAAASEQTGIPSGTIRSWAYRSQTATVARAEKVQAGVQAAKLHRESLREELRTALLTKAVDLLERMDEEHIDYRGKDADKVTYPKAPADACKHYATAAAILLDKFRLEMGDATERHEHTGTLPREERKREIAKLIHMAERREAS